MRGPFNRPNGVGTESIAIVRTSPWHLKASTLPGAFIGRLRNANDEAIYSSRRRHVAGHVAPVGLAQRPPDKPMLVINGKDDATVLPDWVRSAVSRSCALGGRIEYLQIPNAGHHELLPKVTQALERWIADRFAGTPAPSNCPAGQT